MGLSWQQGPLSPNAIGRFLVPEPLPKRLLYAEPLRRRVRVRFGGNWIADTEDVILLFEPGRYPVAYFMESDVSLCTLDRTDHITSHPELGVTSWYTVRAGEQSLARGAWQHTSLPHYALELKGRVAFAWRAMDAFYEEDERIVGHAADSYHRIDIRQSSRNLVVRNGDRIIADTKRPLALYESGFAPRWYVLRADIDESALSLVEHQTFCPYKGLCSYYDIDGAHLGARSYLEPMRKLAESMIGSRSSPTLSRYSWMAFNSISRQVRQLFHTDPIVTSTSPRRSATSHKGTPWHGSYP